MLDTWFSSALWPASTLGWPDETADLARYYPTDVLVTGYDIIFFWVARMMLFCTYIRPEVPFRQVAITGLVRDGRGRKMSKSAGNVVDPLDWMDAYGADARALDARPRGQPRRRRPGQRGVGPGQPELRQQALERHPLRADERGQGAGRRRCRAAGALGGRPLDPLPARRGARRGGRALRAYEFAKVCDSLYHFAWDELFDWYVELAKVPMREGAG